MISAETGRFHYSGEGVRQVFPQRKCRVKDMDRLAPFALTSETLERIHLALCMESRSSLEILQKLYDFTPKLATVSSFGSLEQGLHCLYLDSIRHVP